MDNAQVDHRCRFVSQQVRWQGGRRGGGVEDRRVIHTPRLAPGTGFQRGTPQVLFPATDFIFSPTARHLKRLMTSP